MYSMLIFGVPEKLQVGFYLKQHSTFLLHRDSKKKDEDTLRFFNFVGLLRLLRKSW